MVRRLFIVLFAWVAVGYLANGTGSVFSVTTSNSLNTFQAAPVFTCPNPGSQTAVAAADSYLDQASPATNFGTASQLRVRSQSGSRNRRVLVSFTLPSKPASCTVASAVLRLYVTSATSGRTIGVYRAATPWTETAVNWANQPPTVGSAVTAPSGSTTGWKTWTVTSQVATMYVGADNGFLVRDQTESSGSGPEQVYQSREGTPNDPELLITFG